MADGTNPPLVDEPFVLALPLPLAPVLAVSVVEPALAEGDTVALVAAADDAETELAEA